MLLRSSFVGFGCCFGRKKGGETDSDNQLLFGEIHREVLPENWGREMKVEVVLVGGALPKIWIVFGETHGEVSPENWGRGMKVEVVLVAG